MWAGTVVRSILVLGLLLVSGSVDPGLFRAGPHGAGPTAAIATPGAVEAQLASHGPAIAFHVSTGLNLPGADPSAEPFFDAGAMASSGPWATPIPTTLSHGASANHSNATVRGSPTIGPRQDPGPAAANGTVRGAVLDSVSRRPVVAASVVLSSLGAGCNGVPCPSALTDAMGQFSLSVPPGLYTLTVSALHYAENQTPVTVVSGGTSNLGTILLVEDGIVTGRLLGDDPSHEPLSGFTVSGVSRNNLLLGELATTLANGSFRAWVPPVADRVDFLPPQFAPYEANHTFVFASPGATVDIGTIHLVRGTQLNISLIDRVTGQPLGPNATTRSYACQQRTTLCPITYGDGTGRNATAWAVPGPTVVHVLVVGYVVNVTPIGDVPPEPPGTVVPVTVNVTPMGAVEFTDDLSGGNPSVGGTAIAYDQWWKYIAPGATNVTGAVVCSLEGVLVAIETAAGILPDPCVPNVLSRFGGTAILLGPPLRDWVGIGSFGGVVPMFENMTWVNLTPDRKTSVGYLNFTPGAYVTGDVRVPGSPSPPAEFQVQACSTDERQICGPVVSYTGAANHTTPNASLSGCHLENSSFCVAAPPGPVVVNVVGSSSGIANRTWVEVPYRCCSANPRAVPIWNLSSPHVSTINLTNPGIGRLVGRVAGAGGQVAPPLGFVEVTACRVSTAANPPCTQTDTGNGSFSLNATLGWNQVTVIANGYESNSTWIDVTGRNATGTIVLTPLAIVSGKVVATNGSGVLGANLDFCPIAPAVSTGPFGCGPTSTAATSSGGYYSRPMRGGSFPTGTYQVIATAAGYSGNWTWVNATPGALSVAPTIVLTPVGNASLPGPIGVRPMAANGTLATWVEGSVHDNATGRPLAGVTLAACTLAAPSSCVSFSDSTGTGGGFNATLTLGTYELNVSLHGYVPKAVFVNATGVGTVVLGRIGLVPYPWVAGRVLVEPWTAWSRSAGFGPGAAGVAICTRSGAVCAGNTILNSAGFFNTTAPIGVDDGLWINGTGGSPIDGWTQSSAQGGGAGGFDPAFAAINVSASGSVLNASLGLALRIFSPVNGTLFDGSTYDVRLARPGAPARWAMVTLSGPKPGANLSLYGSGGGAYAALVPANETIRAIGFGDAYVGANDTSIAVPAPGAGGTSVPGLELPHFGWGIVRVVSTAGTPIPGAAVTASRPDPANGSTLSNGVIADGTGFANVSAPPGSATVFTASASGYNSVSATASVQPSRTSNVTLPGLSRSVTELLIRSAEVNDVGVPPLATVRDARTGAAVANVAVSVTNGPGYQVDLATTTNGLGQFLLAVTVEPSETLGFVRDGFSTNYTLLPASPPPVLVVRTENLTGHGVVAGRIVGQPTGAGVPGANVTACPIQGAQLCTVARTNGDGVFWLARPPGGYSLAVTAAGFEDNVSVGTTICSECFAWLGNVTIWADAIVTGSVVGLPLRQPVDGANVTLCPADGSLFLPCFYPTPTDRFGHFTILAPAGGYNFTAQAPGYGPVALPLLLAIGEFVDMGQIALPRDGSVTGMVLDGSTDGPVANATVVACPVGPGVCSGNATTDALGMYHLADVAPGLEALTVRATGYEIGYARLTVASGVDTSAFPVVLWPIGATPHFVLSGTVRWNSSGRPVTNARVTAVPIGIGVPVAATTGTNGTFALDLAVGAYTLTTAAAGGRTLRQPVSITAGPVTNLTIWLVEMTYALHGYVTENGSSLRLAGIRVAAAPWGGTVSGPDGSYALALPNGTFQLSAVPTRGAALAEFGPVARTVRLTGVPASLDIGLPLRLENLSVRLLDTQSGRGVVGAVGVLKGTDLFGVARGATLATGADGGAVAGLPPGGYTLWVNASGYLPARWSVQLGIGPASLVAGLAPRLAGASATAVPLPLLLAFGFDAAAIVVAVLAYRAIRRRRRPPAPVTAPPEGPPPPLYGVHGAEERPAEPPSEASPGEAPLPPEFWG